MITSIIHLRDYGFKYDYNHDTAVSYKKGDWEVIDDLKCGYVVKKNSFVKKTSEDFKEIVKYLTEKKVI